MTASTLTEVMDGLAALLVAEGLASNVYPFPVEAVITPCVVVGYPKFELDTTFGGETTYEHPVWFVIGKGGNRNTRDALSDAIRSAGSVKATLDGPQSFGDVHVNDVEVEEVTIGGSAYLAARFTVEVI